MKNRKLVIILVFVIAIINQLYNLSFTEYNNYDFNDMNALSLKKNEKLVYEKQHLEQTIVAHGDNFNRIRIYLDPVERYYSQMDGIGVGIEVSLYDDSNKLINKYKYLNLFFSEVQTIDFTFPKIENSNGKKYKLHIDSYREAPFFIRLGYVIQNKDNYKLTIDSSEKSDYSLYFQTSYENVNESNGGVFISIIILIVFLGMYIFFANKKDLDIQKKFLIAAVVLNILMLVFTPLFKGNDEVFHWARIIDISNGKFITETVHGWPQSKIPNRIMHIEFDHYNQFLRTLLNSSKIEGAEYVDMEYMAVYPPIAYIPQTLGTLIGKIVTSNAVVWAYLARILQAITCIIIIYFAIKIVPFGKDVLAFIALLPTALRATSLLSADTILFSTILLFIAKILQLIYDKKKILKKDYILLSILSIFIATCKVVYLPFCFLLFLIPLLKKDDRKIIVRNIILILIFDILITGMWNSIAMAKLTAGQGVNTMYLLKYYLHHPFELVQIIIYTFQHQFGNFINDVFGGFNKVYGSIIQDGSIFPIVFLIMYIVLVIKGENKLKDRPKIILGLILIATYILISLSLLLACTPIDKNEIYGIQGRYFIMFLFPIYLIFSNNRNKQFKFDIINSLIIVYLFYFLNYIFIFL